MNKLTRLINNIPLNVIQASALDVPADVIVNAANRGLNPGGGICGAIYQQAGVASLDGYVRNHFPEGIYTGQAVVTPSFALPNHRAIVHAVGPRYEDGTKMEEHLLTMAYATAMFATVQVGKSVTFCGLSTGIYGYPIAQAAWIGVNTIASLLGNLGHALTEVNIALFKQEEFDAFAEMLKASTFGEMI